jgi:hypothetical protein
MNLDKCHAIKQTNQNVQFPAEPNKVINITFFLAKILLSDSQAPVVLTKYLAQHKWVKLRNTIQSGDFIAINLFPHDEQQPKQWTRQLANYLKILRLKPTETSPSVLVDITCLANKNSPAPIILPCLKTSEVLAHIPKKVETVEEIVQGCPQEVNGLILSHLNFFEFDDRPKYDIYYPPNIGTALKAQLSKKAQGIMNVAFLRYLGHGPLLSYNEMQEIDPIRLYVEEFNLPPNRHLALQDITILADLFPNIKRLGLRLCTNIDAIICELSEVQNLKSLDLDQSDVTGKTFDNLPLSLKYLSCILCEKLQDEAILKLKNSSLINLSVAITHLKGTHFDALPNSLKSLTCDCCFDIEDKAILRLSNTSLEEFTLLRCLALTGSYFATLPKTLKIFACNDCPNLQDEAIARLKESRIEVLHLACNPILGTYLSELPNSVRYLNLQNCTHLEDAAILRLQNSSLEELNISQTKLNRISHKHLPRTLKKLTCKNCDNLVIEYDNS